MHHKQQSIGDGALKLHGQQSVMQHIKTANGYVIKAYPIHDLSDWPPMKPRYYVPNFLHNFLSKWQTSLGASTDLEESA